MFLSSENICEAAVHILYGEHIEKNYFQWVFIAIILLLFSWINNNKKIDMHHYIFVRIIDFLNKTLTTYFIVLCEFFLGIIVSIWIFSINRTWFMWLIIKNWKRFFNIHTFTFWWELTLIWYNLSAYYV